MTHWNEEKLWKIILMWLWKNPKLFQVQILFLVQRLWSCMPRTILNIKYLIVYCKCTAGVFFILFSLSFMQVNSAQTLIFCCFMDRVIHWLMTKTAGGQQSLGWADVPLLLIREPFKPASCSDSCPFLSYAVRAADSRMKTIMVQKPPPPLSLLFRTDKQSDLRLITLLSLQVCRGERNDTNTLIPICIYSPLHEELKNSFLLISWIICSLCINHGSPSGRCRRSSVRNSHSDLN